MHQTVAGAQPQTSLGSLQHSPDPLAGFKGPTFKERDGREGGRGRRGKEWKGKGRERKRGREGEGKENLPPLKFRSGYATDSRLCPYTNSQLKPNVRK